MITKKIITRINEMDDVDNNKSRMVNILDYIWSLNSEEFAFEPAVVDIVLSYVEKTILEEENVALLLPIHDVLFDVMRELILAKDRHYKQIYMILLSSLSYHFADDGIRSQITMGFSQLLHSIQFFPVSKLVKCFLE